MPARKASDRGKSERRPQQKGAAKRKPKSAASVGKEREQNLSLIKQVDDLYRPLREAGESELEKTAAGRRLLNDQRSLGEELGELYKNITSGKTPFEEGHRLARARLAEFRDSYQAEYLKAYTRHAHLHPSVEAVAHTLYPEMSSQRIWLSEAAFLQALLLKTKPSDDDVATATQGLRDPPPFPGQRVDCIRPPYPWRADYPGQPIGIGSEEFDSNVDGHLYISGVVYAVPVVASSGSMSASSWVGGDFAAPAGITSFALTVDYDFNYTQGASATFGVALSNLDVAIEVDKMDGTPDFEAAESVSLVISPVPWAQGGQNAGSNRVTLPFTRNTSSAGTMKVRVGLDGRCDATGFLGASDFDASVFVREICLHSTG